MAPQVPDENTVNPLADQSGRFVEYNTFKVPSYVESIEKQGDSDEVYVYTLPQVVSDTSHYISLSSASSGE
jgi:hypothetical protein